MQANTMSSELIYHFDDAELKELVQAIKDWYGYDFSDYSESSFKRRVGRVMVNEGIDSIQALQNNIGKDITCLNSFIDEVTVNVTEMFRDPSFYQALFSKVIPELTHLPLIRIWHAGCSSGEEVYSMAILLKEAGLLDKCLLYATDINLTVLNQAAEGCFQLSAMEEYEENYKKSGGKFSLSNYYEVNEEVVVFRQDLAKRMVFSPHNLAIDQSFNEFNLILCRNVMIYFNRNLQEKVLKLFVDSLADEGYLALGTKESLEFSSFKENFSGIDKKNKIWQIKKS